MSKNESMFKIKGITENNLKNIDFEEATGRIVLISGVSGSGKSTLAHRVIAAEAERQSLLRRKTDDLFYYTVRPKFKSASRLPESITVTQRAIHQTISSTFGTKTKLNELLIKLFVNLGEIIHKGERVNKPEIKDIKEFQQNYYPDAVLYIRLSNYENVDRSQLLSLLSRYKIKTIFLRNEKVSTLKEILVEKLPVTSLASYEIFFKVDINIDIESILKQFNATPVLIGNDLELGFDEYCFSLKDGTVFRQPSALLFSRSMRSSLSGCCKVCLGRGETTSLNSIQAINKEKIIEKGLLDIPLTQSGRYKGFKFLPSGLTALLKKKGVDVKKSFSQIREREQDTIINLLNDKLLSNSKDSFAQQFISSQCCLSCNGSGLDGQARSVTINSKSIDYYLALSAAQLASDLSDFQSNDAGLNKIKTILNTLHNLSIDHISLNRSITTMSSGELQRTKLLAVLLGQESGKIIVLDEPSSNLQYQDNLKIIKIILQMKAKNNCVIIVDHNPIYQLIADRIINIGPGAGESGGQYCPPFDISNITSRFSTETIKYKIDRTKIKYKTLKLTAKRNIKIPSIKIPQNIFTAVIGASGSGKTTLCRDLIYGQLCLENENVLFLDCTPPKGASNSVVATYLNVFDKIRKAYADSNEGELTDSDFSFNSSGACENCNGSGYVNTQICGVCFGSRFKSDTALISLEGKTIVELLSTNLKEIPLNGEFQFLSEAIRIMDLLSLSHLSLGRETSSLSGGELQRLKLARFMIGHSTGDNKKNSYIILDEPCRGLDFLAIDSLYFALDKYLSGSTVIVIEHNPIFIYQCQYIIDLGESVGIKNNNTIAQGFFNDKAFPSLNHVAVMDNVIEIKRKYFNEGQSEPLLIGEENLKKHSNSRYHLIHQFFLKQKCFDAEKTFNKKFEFIVPDKNICFYRNGDVLKKTIENESVFLYNPFINFLEKNDIVPESIYKKIIKKISKINIVYDKDLWNLKIKADSLEEAFIKGGGVVITLDKNKIDYLYHSVRLFSLKDRVADSIYPQEFAFNLYHNSCLYCKGYGYIKTYPFKKWIKPAYSVLDSEMTPYKIDKIIPKTTINRFAKEGIFDFSKKVKELTKREYNFLLYGFKEYRFEKSGANKSNEDDFYEWRGINSYIYNNANKLSPKEDINKFLTWENCPFCHKGFPLKVSYYKINDKSILDYMVDSE